MGGQRAGIGNRSPVRDGSVPTQVIRVYAMDRLARTQAIGGGIVITTNYLGSGDPVE